MGWIQDIDIRILLFIQEHMRFDACNWFWKGITFLGDGGWFWILLAMILVFQRATRNVGIRAMLSMGIGALLTNVLLKNLVARPRPFDSYLAIHPLIEKPVDFSFPSGHTTASFACAWICYWMLPKKYGIVLLGLAILIAYSRMYLGVHYPTDVAAGFVIGFISSMVSDRICRVLEKRKRLSD